MRKGRLRSGRVVHYFEGRLPFCGCVTRTAGMVFWTDDEVDCERCLVILEGGKPGESLTELREGEHERARD